jgi:hypothetical protein
MKNIHVLPTPKPSRLYLHSNNELQLRTNIIRTSEDYLGTNQNIYITSDEEIKEGDWIKWGEAIYKANKKYIPLFKKIILTTDEQLIADGVQAIDDEFLEWFVKNPSCEYVEVEKFFGFAEDYLIIIPQEEPKQKKWDKLNKELDDALDAEFGSEEFKQETIKEVFERFMESNGNQRPTLGLVLGAFSAGSEYQAKKMYSLEEVINIQKEWNDFNEEQNSFNGQDDLTFEEWFNKFKKK